MCPLEAASALPETAAAKSAWNLVRAAGALTSDLDRDGRVRTFGPDGREGLRPVPDGAADVALEWRPGVGWHSRLSAADPQADLVNLYLPICNGTPARPIAVGHLGQSLDGFIATHDGESQFVTGDANIVHLHRMRALCDAVVVGAGTVAADDPQLTTRLVQGSHPLRVVFDPGRRLTPDFRLFTDQSAPTLYICEDARQRPGERRMGSAAVAGIEPGSGAAGVLALLRDRGCARVFVEGGGVTVSAFLEAGALDRLHVAVAPVIIGDGRPAIRLQPPARLRDCLRPAYRVFRMGGDVLFDFDLGNPAEPGAPHVTRVI